MALFRETVRDAEILLIKGSERCAFLRKLFPHLTVVNLDDLGCPPAKLLEAPADAPQCFYYTHIPTNVAYKECTCSLKQAYKFKLWCECTWFNIKTKQPSSSSSSSSSSIQPTTPTQPPIQEEDSSKTLCGDNENTATLDNNDDDDEDEELKNIKWEDVEEELEEGEEEEIDDDEEEEMLAE